MPRWPSSPSSATRSMASGTTPSHPTSSHLEAVISRRILSRVKPSDVVEFEFGAGDVPLRLWLVHVHQRATLLDVLQLSWAQARMFFRAVDRLEPNQAHDDAHDPHEVEHVGPAEGSHEPAHDRREQGCREILRRVEDGRSRAALVGWEPR